MSPLHNRNALKLAIENSTSIKDILIYLGLSTSGSAYSQVRKWAAKHQLEIPKSYRPAFKSQTLEDRLQNGVRTRSSKLLLDLVAAGYKHNKCEECGQNNVWNGKPLTLHLDHIDGDHDNNLLANLRVLCPHCHQQTPTFGAKNIKSKPARKYFCECGKEKDRGATQCKDCHLQERQKLINQTDIPWPPVEDILLWLETASFIAVGKKIGVSDNAVRKYIKRSGHEVPKRYNMAAK